MPEDNPGGPAATILDTPDLAGALESEQFRRFLDQVPIAIVVADIKGAERVVYANPEFERLSGQGPLTSKENLGVFFAARVARTL